MSIAVASCHIMIMIKLSVLYKFLIKLRPSKKKSAKFSYVYKYLHLMSDLLLILEKQDKEWTYCSCPVEGLLCLMKHTWVGAILLLDLLLPILAGWDLLPQWVDINLVLLEEQGEGLVVLLFFHDGFLVALDLSGQRHDVLLLLTVNHKKKTWFDDIDILFNIFHSSGGAGSMFLLFSIILWISCNHFFLVFTSLSSSNIHQYPYG